jgi:DNA-binding transcriptional ArsR family regulator
VSDPVRIFAALADPTRQQLVDWMASGETGTATEFAERLPMSRQAVARHLTALAKAGLVTGLRRGKEVRYGFNPEPLVEAESWLVDRGARWERTLEGLARHLDTSEAGR